MEGRMEGEKEKVREEKKTEDSVCEGRRET